MKKYAFLVYHKEYAGFLEKLREIGVVHVAERQGGTIDDDELRGNLQLLQRFKAATEILERHTDGENPLAQNPEMDGFQLLTEIETCVQEKEQLQTRRQSVDKDMDRMAPWGNFSWERIRQLEKAGLELRFFACNSSRFNPEWESQYNAIEVDCFNSTIYFVTVTPKGTDFELDADLLRLGAKTEAELQEEAKEIDAEILAIEDRLKQATSGYDALKKARAEVSERVDLRRVQLNTNVGAEDTVMILEGYCPEENEAALNKMLKKSGVYYMAEVPRKSDDAVPVKLKNNKFSSVFEFIGGLYELPNYHKSDMTPYFAPFYMLFFGFCFADVVYGVILAAVGIYFRKKVREELEPVMRLLTYLGITAFFMGILTGNVGGIALEKIETNWPWYEHLKHYILTADRLFYASLILGAVQIIFGQFVRAITRWKTDGFASTISTWGWLLLVVGGGSVFGLQKGGLLAPEIAKTASYVIFAVAGICIFLLNHPGHNILANIGEGIWDTYEKATGWLSDLLSYIRLFAICIAGAVLAIVFNSLATSLSGDTPVVSQIVMILILAFGHFINIFMAILASFVHPLRLTFVEFYKNAGFVGGGKSYKPFARYKEEFKIL
ncbi:V-type ATP synthase subunit I [Paludibacter jiangxiensis]|nr:V-type ATPase 116kDa subunit family protein [Paludibacter jiangxiensis]